MSNPLKDNRLPLIVSGLALIVATYIGFVPLMQRDDPPAPAASNNSAEVAALNARIAALEAALANSAGSGGPTIPEGADNARLRQEIDLIVKGLSNQTGRVSRLKAVVEGITDDNGNLIPSAQFTDEITLAKRGLANQTGRVSRLKSVVDGITDDNGNLIPSSRVMDEIALAKRGLANLTRRTSDLSNRLDALNTAAADIARLQQQMANVDRAFSRMAARSNQARIERAALSAALDSGGSASGTQLTSSSQPSDLEAITAKLDAILSRLGE